jgi:hypothetical protein
LCRKSISYCHQKFLYGLNPLPSGRFSLDARQCRAYLFGALSLQGGGNSPGSYPPGRSPLADSSRLWSETCYGIAA